MKLKLDENLGVAAHVALEAAGHDVSTVLVQSLQAALDDDLILQCKLEGRALVTLDLDFANPLRFRPADYPGIAVLRLPSEPSERILDDLLHTLVGAATGTTRWSPLDRRGRSGAHLRGRRAQTLSPGHVRLGAAVLRARLRLISSLYAIDALYVIDVPLPMVFVETMAVHKATP